MATPERPGSGFDKLENIEFIDQSTPADVTYSNVKGYHTIDTSQEQKNTSRVSSSSGDDVFKTLPVKQQKTKVSCISQIMFLLSELFVSFFVLHVFDYEPVSNGKLILIELPGTACCFRSQSQFF